MGSAVLTGILNAPAGSDSPFTAFTACVRSEASAQKLKARFGSHSSRLQISFGNWIEVASAGNVVLIGTKPYALKDVLGAPGMGDALRGKLVLSILAGISPAQILKTLYGDEVSFSDPPCRVVQSTLNLAARLGQSMTVLNDAALSMPAPERAITEWVFSQIGQVSYLPANMMAAAATFAATPAMLSLAVDGLLDGAVAQGVQRGPAR